MIVLSPSRKETIVPNFLSREVCIVWLLPLTIRLTGVSPGALVTVPATAKRLLLVTRPVAGVVTSTIGSLTSQYTVIETIVQVVDSAGQPVEGESVTVEYAVDGIKYSYVKTTDSTGWTCFITEAVKIPKDGQATVTVYFTNNKNIGEIYAVYYSEAKNKAVDGVYYWSLSPRLLKV